MIDLSKIPTLAREWLSGMLDREAAKTGRYADDLPEPPPGVDPLGWRIAHGHFRPDLPKRYRLETRGPEALEVKFRDGPG
jgi:hypothetical protein